MDKNSINKQKTTSTNEDLARSYEAKQLFLSRAMSMSWQLAVVFLAPLLGGYYLDQHYKTGPLYTLIGFGLAIIFSGLVVYKNVKMLPEYKNIKKG